MLRVTWHRFILSESDYWGSLYKKGIPTIFKNETDIGIARTEASRNHGEPYYAFDEVLGPGNGVVCGKNKNFWIEYQFKNESDYIAPKVAWFYNSADGGYGKDSTGYFSASIDGINYDILATFKKLLVEKKNKVILNSTKKYKYFRCTLTEINNTYGQLNYRIEFKIYGL